MKCIFIPGLVSDNRAWSAVESLVTAAGVQTGIADLSAADSIETMATAVLSQFNGPILPVGHSMGGRVAMEIARQAPDRLVGLVLVATGAHPLAAGEVANRERVIDLANQQGMQALCDQWLPPMLAPGTKETNSSLYQSLQQMVLDAGVALHERQIRALINRPDATNVLKQMSVPTLFVAGEHDGWSTPAQHSQMAERVSSSEVYQLDGVGHFLQAEAPQEFSQLLLGWMARQQMV